MFVDADITVETSCAARHMAGLVTRGGRDGRRRAARHEIACRRAICMCAAARAAVPDERGRVERLVNLLDGRVLHV